jgi:hypothetical protein
MERIAFDVISIELFNKENKMSKHIAATEDQKRIAFQLGLDPDALAQQVALNSQRSDGDGDRSPYVSFSTADLRRSGRVALHESTNDTDTLVRALSDAAVSAVSAQERGDHLALDRSIRNAFSTCQKLLAGPFRAI